MGQISRRAILVGVVGVGLAACSKPSARLSAPPDTTAHSQPDPRCDAQPVALGRRAAALAAHREAAEGQGQGASRRGCGQGARQSQRASAARH